MSELSKIITFNKEEKTFTICKGDTGTYPYNEVKKCDILYEDSAFHGVSKPFSHTVLISMFHYQVVMPRFLYVGLKITFKNNKVVYAYVSTEPYQIGTDSLIHDQKNAELLKNKFDKIISKYG